MQISPEELDFYLKQIIESKMECLRLKELLLRKEEECEKLKQASPLLAAQPEADEAELRIPVEEVCKLMEGLNDFKMAAFFFTCLLKIMRTDIPRETFFRILQSIVVKKSDNVNIQAEGDVNIEALNNLGTLLAAQKIVS